MEGGRQRSLLTPHLSISDGVIRRAGGAAAAGVAAGAARPALALYVSQNASNATMPQSNRGRRWIRGLLTTVGKNRPDYNFMNEETNRRCIKEGKH